MRCLNCHFDPLPPETEVCPNCGVYLPALIRDLLPNGTLLNSERYKIDYPLGKGGFGITYRGFDLTMERAIAIKEFYPQEHAQREGNTKNLIVSKNKQTIFQRSIQRFLREGKILAQLKHPNVVTVYDLFQEKGTAYLVMELIDGETLRNRLDRQPNKCFSSAQVKQFIDSLVAVLTVLHEQDIYHLDLKPDNILITEAGRLVLIDFGASRQGLGTNSTQACTPDYAPPEVFAGEGMTAESDLFELGMMLHEMLTGEKPPTSLVRITNDTWKPSNLASPWDKLISQALQLQKKDRPSNVKTWWKNAFKAPQQIPKTVKIDPQQIPKTVKIAPEQKQIVQDDLGPTKYYYLLIVLPVILLAIGGIIFLESKNFNNKLNPQISKHLPKVNWFKVNWFKNNSKQSALKEPDKNKDKKTTEIIENNSNNKQSFPQSTCGDKHPTNPAEYPVTFYRVYIEYSPENLEKVKSDFCQDAFVKNRKDRATQWIQVSSFKSLEKAENFQTIIEKEFNNSEIGTGKIFTIKSDRSEAEENNKPKNICQQINCPHTNLIPLGEYNYYEKDLNKRVSYVRQGNLMVGALYDFYRPDLYTCFSAIIQQNGVNITWWNNLWQIRRSGQSRYVTYYTITNFTVGNVMPFNLGLENPAAVQECQRQQ